MSDLSEARKQYIQSTLSPMSLMFPTIDLSFITEWINNRERLNQKVEARTSGFKPSAPTWEFENVNNENESLYLNATDKTIPYIIKMSSKADKNQEIVKTSIDIEALKSEDIIDLKGKLNKLMESISVKPKKISCITWIVGGIIFALVLGLTFLSMIALRIVSHYYIFQIFDY